MPLAQCAVDEHAYPEPHPPQFEESVWKLTHAPLHSV
jgi:hypothetical protein